MPFTLSGKTGKLVIEVTEDSKGKKNKVYTYTLFYGSDERRADFLTDGTAEDFPDLAVRNATLSPYPPLLASSANPVPAACRVSACVHGSRSFPTARRLICGLRVSTVDHDGDGGSAARSRRYIRPVL